MQDINLVIYHNDPRTAQALVTGLSQLFASVKVAKEHKELRSTIAWNRADVLVLDVEASEPGEIGQLHQEFPALSIVGVHRLADERLWTEVLDQGATDLCEPRDEEVARSVMRERVHHAAA